MAAAAKLPAQLAASSRTLSAAAVLGASASQFVVGYALNGAKPGDVTEEPALTCKTLAVTLATGLVVAASGCGGTSCHDIVNEYEDQTLAASTCDLTSSDPCPVMLPIVIVQVNADGGHTVVNLAADCDAAFNATGGAKLQLLYSQFQAMGCQLQPVPICQSGPTQCIVQSQYGAVCYPN